MAPTCFVVGEGIVPLRCLAILKAHGFVILGVHSGDGSLEAIAAEHAWPYDASLDAFKSRLESQAYDFLFSINNGWLVPDPLIAKATRAAINYHDSNLPAYAGLHATSWALLHGERMHGISWHELTSKIDGGRIFKRRAVAVAPDDTALTLNTRCYEAAVAAFEELAPELASHTEKPEIQPESGRSYFGGRDRPRAACTISFEEPAASIANLVRALDFGPPRNPLGLPKVRCGGEVLAVTSALVHAGEGAPPGRVVEADPSAIRVGTAHGDVTLRGLRTLAGAAIDAEAMRACGLASGAQLAAIDAEEADAITAFYARVCRFETAWGKRLASLAPFAHPYSPPQGKVGPAARTPMPEVGSLVASMPLEEADRATKLAALFAAYARRLSTEAVLDIGLCVSLPPGVPATLFSSLVPLRLASTEGDTFAAFETTFDAELTRVQRLETFARDLYPRMPALRTVGPARLPMAIAIADTPDALDVEAFDADVILAAYRDGSPPEQITRGLAFWQTDAIARQLARFVDATMRDPSALVARLPILDDAERTRLLETWNATSAPFPAVCVHALVTAQAARTPDAPAVRFDGVEISYATLERKSNQLARKLASLGVGRGSLVALCLRRSIDVVIGLLGILKAGAAYVPIDPAYPPGRVAHMIDDSGAPVVLTERVLCDRFFAAHAGALCIDEARAELDALDDAPFDAGATPEDRVYVIYTSGSTGTPKGVEVLHRGLVNHSVAIAENYGLGPGDRLLCSASISFDVAGEQIYPALFRGAEVVVRPDDLFDTFTRFDRFVRDESLTAMVLPTAFWHEWVRELVRTKSGAPPTLRALSTGTEKVIGEYLASWQALSGGRVRFFQGYGPTETTITSTMYAHDGSSVDKERAVPIGRPLPNTEIYILDTHREPVPVGMPGEIYIGGAGLARGYLGREELTAEKFVAHPFREGARLYRTGDLARFEPDGQAVYLGRTDFQVKLRGFRIELGEIESVLRHVEGVDEAAVILREDGGHKRLVAYVVARGALDLAAARAFAIANLPEYMVPSAIVKLDAFPMTPNQKLDRAALPPPPDEARAVVAPRTDLERAIASLWAEQLRLAAGSFGVGDDFFALGGDSLRAVGMLSALESRLGACVPLSAFARAPTIEGLANRAADGNDAEEPLTVVVQAGDPSRAPLWLLHPVGGHVVFGNWLRAGMSPKQPLIGIQARGLDGKRAPLATVEDMAALYIDIIRAAQPRGPYFVAGPSMGGYLAVEIAIRLRALGEEVALLALLDTWGPGYPRPTSLAVRLLDNARALRAIPTWSARMTKIRKRFFEPPSERDRIVPPRYDVLDALASHGSQDRGSLLKAIEAVMRANEQANMTYRPPQFDIPVVLLRAERGIPNWSGVRFDEPTNGWGPYARGGVRTIPFPCEHLDLVDEPTPAVGRVLQHEIDRACARARASGSASASASASLGS